MDIPFFGATSVHWVLEIGMVPMQALGWGDPPPGRAGALSQPQLSTASARSLQS